jgi:hypothetical protein
MLPPLKPIPIKDRVSVVFVEKGQLDVLDGAFVVVDKNGVRTHIPSVRWHVSCWSPAPGCLTPPSCSRRGWGAF